MGIVFLAEDPQLQRRVALKVLRPMLASNTAARQRFLREARAAAAIEHDHIVTIYQVGEDRGVPFLAMQFLKGESLEARLHRDGALPVPEVLRIGREVAAGLAAAHEHGLIHRDIKPANIWLETTRPQPPERGRGAGVRGSGTGQDSRFRPGRAADGSSRLTQTGAIVGTPAYMAPSKGAARRLMPGAICSVSAASCTA